MDKRRFPILSGDRSDGPTSVPWSIVEPHREQALRNHGQTLERLAERGGLGWAELFAVMAGRSYYQCFPPEL